MVAVPGGYIRGVDVRRLVACSGYYVLLFPPGSGGGPLSDGTTRL